jgi:hypothetical protein
MKDNNAASLLAEVMGWDESVARGVLPRLQLFADYKYDHYQQFSPGRRFIEALALWLRQFDEKDRANALRIVTEHLIFVSDREMSHLVQTSYPDWIVPELINLVAEEQGLASYEVGRITTHPRFRALKVKTLYLGLSDGARTSELRRSSGGEISNEQIWHAYELSDEKAQDMLKELKDRLLKLGVRETNPRFHLIWLLDDFAGSGRSFIRYDTKTKQFKGKLRKIYDRLHKGDAIDTSHYEVYLLLYVATKSARDHIMYWSERFASSEGYNPPHIRVIQEIDDATAVRMKSDADIRGLIEHRKYYDHNAFDRHFLVGGTSDARYGFAACGLPLVLAHNTPNNSIYLLWGPEQYSFQGLFPRVSRHREF